MQPAQFQNLKQAVAAFESLQEKHKYFGADDKSVDYQFQRGIKEMVTQKKNIFPLEVSEWGLYTNMPDCQQVSDALNEAALQVTKALEVIDWNSPLTGVIKTYLADYCQKFGLFQDKSPAKHAKLHSMASYAGVKWINPKNDDYDPGKSWEENYRGLEARHAEEKSYLIGKVRELAANLPANVLLSTKLIHVIQMSDGKYVQDWNNSPGKFEFFTTADPFMAVHFSEEKIQEIFQTCFASRGGKMITLVMALKVVESPDAEQIAAKKTVTYRLVEKFVLQFKQSAVVQAFARATREHVQR
jgi:hypothetical protein